ncbi:hypothetical protein L7F22_019836 [Adiantum nelumboides]|nr:hypothetical protein [Adiantum nelumboides]
MSVLQKADPAKLREKLAEIVDASYSIAKEEAAKGRIEPKRGKATIPLPGIDVPFHSSVLRGGVAEFRSYLSKRVGAIKPKTLVGKYIPNLTAKPFQLTKEYTELTYEATRFGSTRLAKILRNWEKDGWDTPDKEQELCRTLLIELLAYQFASCVRWIETQDVFFEEPFSFERLVEFGPSPTLVGMASRTHKIRYAGQDQAQGKRRVMLCHSKDQEPLYYSYADMEDDSAEAGPSSQPDTTSAPVAAAPTPVAAPAPAAAPSGGAAAADVPDAPLNAFDVVRCILAQKLKKPLSEITPTKSIKDLVGGKSVMANEIQADLLQEFGSMPERGEELPVEELGASLNSGYSGTLGKYTSGLVTRMVGGKLPGSFNMAATKSYLQKTWGLGPGRTESVLLFGIVQEPAKRLGSDPEAKAWLDSAVQAYASSAGLQLSQAGAGGGGGGGGGGATISSEELEKLESRHNEHARRQIQILERYIGIDGRQAGRLAESIQQEVQELRDQLDEIAAEHGEAYTKAILPRFDARKARNFASYWNWSRQDALLMWCDILAGRLTAVDREVARKSLTLMSRADETLLGLMEYTIGAVDPEDGPTYALAKEFGQMLIDNCREALSQPATFKEVYAPTAPHTLIDGKGNIIYSEEKRVGVRKMEAYVKEMAAGTRAGPQVDIDAAREQMSRLWTLIKNEPTVSRFNKSTIKSIYGEIFKSLGPTAIPRNRINAQRQRTRRLSSNVRALPVDLSVNVDNDRQPHLQIKRRVGTDFVVSQKLTKVYLTILEDIAKNGVTFKGQNVLITGAGRGSIALEVARGLLAGGARVIITTSSYSRKQVSFYQSLYQSVGAKSSQLTIVPWNAASKRDTEALVNYIYEDLALDLDSIVPFAAIPDAGSFDTISDKSEVAHRAMLTNLVRLLGYIKSAKESRGFRTRPTVCINPLSPNRGQMGGGGLYSESKVALETLANRSVSEGWSEYISITGCIIGWVRGTGLMDANNAVAEEIEKQGMRTFSSIEMGFNLLGCLHPVMTATAQVEPIVADLSGGFTRVPDLATRLAAIRVKVYDEAARRRAISLEQSADFKVIKGAAAEALHQTVKVEPRANFRWEFPKIDPREDILRMASPNANIDLEKTLVVTGFAEVGPWGSSRTRWEMEAYGHFTIEGCIEMAWMMGMIRFVDGKLKNGKTYVGWVDAKTEETVTDAQVKTRYEEEILAHSGVRLVEPELFRGYDPQRKGYVQEVEIQHDLEPLDVSLEEGSKYKLEHGDRVDVWPSPNGGSFVQFKKGARIHIPMAIKFTRAVSGQIPTGWHAGRFGIPEDLQNIDRTSLWALVCVTEALAMSGVTDPYELYKYAHVSEVGVSIGSGMGGQQSLSAMFRDRRQNMDVQKDILQETFINTVAGWCNLLLMSSSGPILSVVGACATALQSMAVASEAILSGKAKFMLVGGNDDLSEEGATEFANMGATISSTEDSLAGREPSEMSRPMTTTRGGFMESQGGAVQCVCTAAFAIQAGLPIQAVVAHVSTHTDKQGRSIPAPGHGVLSSAEPLRRTMGQWGLTGDSIGVISMHGTSTKANDKNESHVYHQLMKYLGRTPCNAVPAVAQKWLCGHAKGGAAGWAMNGLIQSIQHATVPGNRNADDISPELRDFSYLLYASQTIKRPARELHVGLLTSFGFGQVGGIAMVLHPNHVLAHLTADQLAVYAGKRSGRQSKTYAKMHSALTRNDLVQVKEAAPYTNEMEDKVLLNLNARAVEHNGSYAFREPLASPPSKTSSVSLAKTVEAKTQEKKLSDMMVHVAGIGIDCESVSTFPADNENFIGKNFTEAEITYCKSQPDVRASFCGKFCAKEAVFKSMGIASRGIAAPMNEIEIASDSQTGAPQVALADSIKQHLPSTFELKSVKFLVSISHNDDLAVAIAHRVPA